MLITHKLKHGNNSLCIKKTQNNIINFKTKNESVKNSCLHFFVKNHNLQANFIDFEVCKHKVHAFSPPTSLLAFPGH